MVSVVAIFKPLTCLCEGFLRVRFCRRPDRNGDVFPGFWTGTGIIFTYILARLVLVHWIHHTFQCEELYRKLSSITKVACDEFLVVVDLIYPATVIEPEADFLNMANFKLMLF